MQWIGRTKLCAEVKYFNFGADNNPQWTKFIFFCKKAVPSWSAGILFLLTALPWTTTNDW